MTALQASPSYLHDGKTACIAVSPGDLRQLFGQVEAEFQDSKVYRKILSWFQHQLKDNEELVSQLASALGREAIRLTLRQLVVSQVNSEDSASRSGPAAESSPQKPQPATTAISPVLSAVSDRPAAPNPFEFSGETAADAVEGATEIAARDDTPVQTSLDSFSEVPPAADCERHQLELESASTLAEVGAVLKQVRQQRGLTTDQLHRATHVPNYHIRAIENGATDQLPEAIYVRGFVRHLCSALGLEIPPLMRDTPLASSATGRNRSMSPPLAPSSSYLRPAHLYTGYATLMLGALGGLCWVTWQPIAADIDWPEPASIDKASLTEANSAPFLKEVASKLRYFELSKQRSRHLEVDSIAGPELILEKLQGTPVSEVP